MQPAAFNSIALPARNLKSAIQFLRRLDVPASRIATLLGESADNIRHLDSRSYVTDEEIHLAHSVGKLAKTYLADAGHWTALRIKQRGQVYGQSKQRLENLVEMIAATRTQHERDLPTGFAALRRLLPYVGNATTLETLKVKSLLEENLSWFAAHMGLSRSAYQYATAAMNHCKQCYDESLGDKEHLIAYARAALIASNALLLSHKPAEAMLTLNLAYEAKFAAGEPLGSEWYRQLATALLQHQGYDHLASKLYDKAGEEMQRQKECAHPLSIQMNRDRQQSLLRPVKKFEQAQELVTQTETTFGQYSLEHMMSCNWAAAAAFELDDQQATNYASELLHSVMSQPLSFEHQKTVTRLLLITPDLPLRGPAKDSWLRFALYENTARSK